MKPNQIQKQLPELARLFQAGRLAEARALGRQLLAALPRQPQVLAMLGAIHGRLGEFHELHLEGTVQAAPAMPVSAAAWLFGSGLLGLMGCARRKTL